jgi:hypothetical protein
MFDRAVADRRRALAERARDVELMRRDWRAHLRAGDDGLARIALEEAERAEVERDHLALDVEHAEARLAEWEVTPGKLDAALDFYSNVSATIQGRIRQAEDATQLRGALADLLNGVWVKVEDDGRVTADLSVKTPDDAERAGATSRSTSRSRSRSTNRGGFRPNRTLHEGQPLSDGGTPGPGDQIDGDRGRDRIHRARSRVGRARGRRSWGGDRRPGHAAREEPSGPPRPPQDAARGRTPFLCERRRPLAGERLQGACDRGST